MKSHVLAIALLAISSSCAEPNGIDERFPDEIKVLVGDRPVYSVNLDEVPVRIVSVDSLMFRYSGQDSTLIVASPGSVLAFHDRLLVTDTKADHVVVLDSLRDVVDVVGRTGEGPGEFSMIGSLATNGKSIFALDITRRVQIFDENVRLSGGFPTDGFDGQLLVHGGALAVPTPFRTSHVVLFRSTAAPYDSVASILPFISNQPPVINIYSGTVDVDHRRLYISYHSQPMLFCYDDDYRHLFSIELTGSLASRQLDNFTIDDGSGNMGIRGFIRAMVYLGNSTIGFSHKNVLYVVRANRSGVKLVDAISFVRSGNTSSRPVHLESTAYDGRTFYNGSRLTGQVHFAALQFDN